MFLELASYKGWIQRPQHCCTLMGSQALMRKDSKDSTHEIWHLKKRISRERGARTRGSFGVLEKSSDCGGLALREALDPAEEQSR
jgi:hypothetical protein